MSFIGVDLGTSGTKALLLGPSGEILAKKTAFRELSNLAAGGNGE